MARDNSGALFTNDNAEHTEDAPYASGKMTFQGKEYYLDAWKITENGEDQLDMQFKAKGSSRKLSDGDGFMHRNKAKKNDKHPDWKGEIKHGYDKYEIAGWRRKSDKGVWYLSLAISVGQQQQTREEPKGEYPF
jgi:hypothetical protein